MNYLITLLEIQSCIAINSLTHVFCSLFRINKPIKKTNGLSILGIIALIIRNCIKVLSSFIIGLILCRMLNEINMVRNFYAVILANTVRKAELVIPTQLENLCLNKLHMKPKVFYKYKLITVLIENTLFLLPLLIYYKFTSLEIILILIYSLCINSIVSFINIWYFNKYSKIVSFGFRYLLYFILIFSVTKMMSLSFYYIIIIIPIAMYSMYYLKNNDYTKLGNKMKSEHVYRLVISFDSYESDNSDMNGLNVFTSKMNKEYYESNKELVGFEYYNKAFIERNKSNIDKIMRNKLVSFAIYLSILFITLRLNNITLNQNIILEYSSVLLAIVSELCIAYQYFNLCFYHSDYLLLSNHLITKEVINKCINLRLRDITKRNLILFSLFALTLFGVCIVYRIDFHNYMKLIVILLCYLVLIQLYEFAVYYLYQPFVIQTTIKKPMAKIFSFIPVCLDFVFIFGHGNILKYYLIVVLFTIIITMAVLKLIYHFAFKCFRL